MKAAPIDPTTVTFAFEDPERRTFVALNRAGDAYHLVHPAEPDDIRVTGHPLDDGSLSEPKVAAGDLVCECRGGRFHGHCYAVSAALLRLEVDFGPQRHPLADEPPFPGDNGAGSEYGMQVDRG